MALTKLSMMTLVLGLMGSILIPTGFVMEIRGHAGSNTSAADNATLARSVNESLCASLHEMNVTLTVVMGGACMEVTKLLVGIGAGMVVPLFILNVLGCVGPKRWRAKIAIIRLVTTVLCVLFVTTGTATSKVAFRGEKRANSMLEYVGCALHVASCIVRVIDLHRERRGKAMSKGSVNLDRQPQFANTQRNEEEQNQRNRMKTSSNEGYRNRQMSSSAM